MNLCQNLRYKIYPKDLTPLREIQKKFSGNWLARISHQLSDKSHTLSPHLAPQHGESVSHEHCPHRAEKQSKATRERFVQRSGEKCGLGSIIVYTGLSIEKLAGNHTWAVPAWRLFGSV